MTRPYIADDVVRALFPGQSVADVIKQLHLWTGAKPYLDFVAAHNLDPGDWLTAFKVAVIVRQPLSHQPLPHQPPALETTSDFEIDIAL